MQRYHQLQFSVMGMLSLHKGIPHSAFCPANKESNPWWFGLTGLLWSDTLCYKHPRPKECMVLLYSYQVIFKDLC